MHCVIENFVHVLFSPDCNRTTLVDFDRWRLIESEEPDRADMQMWQQVQLLSLVANVCNDARPLPIPIINPCFKRDREETEWVGSNGLRQKVMSAFKRCNFEMEWEAPVDGKWTVEEISYNYGTLRDWTVVPL